MKNQLLNSTNLLGIPQLAVTRDTVDSLNRTDSNLKLFSFLCLHWKILTLLGGHICTHYVGWLICVWSCELGPKQLCKPFRDPERAIEISGATSFPWFPCSPMNQQKYVRCTLASKRSFSTFNRLAALSTWNKQSESVFKVSWDIQGLKNFA